AERLGGEQRADQRRGDVDHGRWLLHSPGRYPGAGRWPGAAADAVALCGQWSAGGKRVRPPGGPRLPRLAAAATVGSLLVVRSRQFAWLVGRRAGGVVAGPAALAGHARAVAGLVVC